MRPLLPAIIVFAITVVVATVVVVGISIHVQPLTSVHHHAAPEPRGKVPPSVVAVVVIIVPTKAYWAGHDPVEQSPCASPSP